MSWNIQSKNCSIRGNKFDIEDFTKIINNCHVVCLQEIRKEIEHKNFLAFNNTRSTKRAGGGVCILIHKSLTPHTTRIKCNESSDIVTIRISKEYMASNRDLIIVCCYISPSTTPYRRNSNTDPWEVLNDHIIKLSSINDSEIIICGDFNARTSNLSDIIKHKNLPAQIPNALDFPLEFNINDNNTTNYNRLPDRNNTDTQTNTDGKQLIDLCIANELIILNGRTFGDLFGQKTFYSSRGSSCLDYFLTKTRMRSSINSLRILPYTRFSDHCPLILSTTAKLPNICPISIKSNSDEIKSAPKRFKTNNPSNLINYTERLKKADVTKEFDNIISNINCVDKSVDIFTETLIKIASETLGIAKTYTNKFNRQSRKTQNKWFNNNCKNSLRQLRRSLRKFNKNRECKISQNNYFKSRKTYRQTTRNSKRAYFKNLNEKIESGKIIDWKNFNTLKTTRVPPKTLEIEDLEAFTKYFEKLYKRDNNTNYSHTSNSSYMSISDKSPSRNDQLNSPITLAELTYAVKTLKTGKSSSEDQISNEMIKHLSHLGLGAMRKVFNLCLSKGKYPWHTSLITPIHKSGDSKNPDNYRAIAVGSCLGKTFSTILLNRLLSFRRKYCPDPVNQLGFSKGAQTNDHILTLKTIIDKYYTKKTGKSKKLFACFIDLRKAFDNVNRSMLLNKLEQLKIEGNFFNVLSDMYNNSTAKLKINNYLSNSFKIEKGTEQGHPMSPDLFKIFIKDLSKKLKTSGSYPSLDNQTINHLLWADDLVLLALDGKSLQTNLDIINQFCKNSELEINIKKTKIIEFGRKSNQNFYIGDEQIKRTDEYCYLGVVFSKNGKLTVARNELRKKALRSLYGLKRYVHRDHISLNSLILLFDALIKPVLLYGCQIITPHAPITKHLYDDYTDTNYKQYLTRIYRDPYEKFQIKFLKWCLGVHSRSSNIGVYGETARIPIIMDAIKLSIDYFCRCEELPESSLTKKAFNEQKKLSLDWFKHNNEILNRFNNANSSLSRPSITVYKNLRNQFLKFWTSALENSPKLEFYNLIKHEFRREKYLNINEFQLRSSLTKILISSHDLEIEKGRYTNVPRDTRLCKYCNEILNINELEDEAHALNVCPLYSLARDKLSNLLNRDLTQSPTYTHDSSTNTTASITNTLSYILSKSNDGSEQDITHLYHISKFCLHILEHRKAFIKYLSDYTD